MLAHPLSFFRLVLINLIALVIAASFSIQKVYSYEHDEEVSDDIEVPVIEDIRPFAEKAKAKNIPILLIFSSDHCPFCELLKEDFLKPMLRSGDYEERCIIAEINIDSGSSLVDFNGQDLSTDSFAYRYNVSMFPTMLMLNAQGKQVSHRILGINTPEMFGGRIDAMIDLANQQPKPISIGSNKQQNKQL